MANPELIVRPVVVSDADQFLALWDALDTETENMLFAPGERQATLEQQVEQLSKSIESADSAVFVLENVLNTEIAGFIGCRQNTRIRDRHCAYLVLGIKQKYTGQGWGGKLLFEAENWAISRGLHRLELSVMANNEFAIKLYERFGFNIEGTKRDAVKLNSGYCDEHVMGKLL